MFRAPSNHKYDTADYTQIDPHFGTNADFVRLCAEAAKRGIRVLPDTSINHTGSESVYFDRYGNYGGKGAFSGGKINPSSPYADWYTFIPGQADPDKQYKSWLNIESLPEVNKASPSFRAFIYGNKDGVMEQWLDRGAAGWRMDVAPWVPDDFWREWRQAVKHHRPDALTVAETWFDASKFFLGDEFDSTMNYIFRSAVLDYAKGDKATKAYRSLEYMREVYPPQVLFALMNVLSSHDVERSLYTFGFKDETTPAARVREAKQRLLLATFFQMTYPGSPTIYYGDEVGVTGANDPYDRGTYPWPDLGGKPDNALLADFKALVRLRRDNPVLRRGSLQAPLLINDHLIVQARQLGPTWAIIASKNDLGAQSVTVALPDGCAATTFVDALSHQTVKTDGNKLTLVVPSLFGTALVGK
jgi:glycosidase